MNERRRLRVAVEALMAVMVATLALASALHYGVVIAGVADRFEGAALPEAVIAAVLAAGLGALVRDSRHAWGWSIGATSFAIAGFLVGLRFTLFATPPAPAGDVAYHIGGLALLVVIAGALLSARGRSARR
jgi:hypothetical protein